MWLRATSTARPRTASEPKWRPEYAEALRGADVMIIADRDAPGVAHARAIAASLHGKAKSVTIMQAAVDRAHADVSDHLDAGLGLDDLVLRRRSRRRARLDGDSEGKRSQASRLVELAMERFDLVMSDDGRPYGITRNGPNIALPLRGSRGLRTRLAAIFADDDAGHRAVAVGTGRRARGPRGVRRAERPGAGPSPASPRTATAS